MSSERIFRILERLTADKADGPPVASSLCTTATEVLDLPGAALLLVDGAASYRATGVAGDLMGEIEQIQHTFGDGPCVDAHVLGVPVLEPDLASPEVTRWAGFTAPAVAAGARAVFGFPLQVGGARIGALNLCADRSGALTGRQHADALTLAEISTHAILAIRADAPIENLADELRDVGAHRVVVHQATGMVAVQVGAAVGDALARLRAHAFVTDRPISAVAADVVGRRLRFDP